MDRRTKLPPLTSAPTPETPLLSALPSKKTHSAVSPVISKAALDALRAQRPRPNESLTYEIDGPVHARVKSTLESERIGRINRGDRVLKEAVERFRRSVIFKARSGQAHGAFKHVSQPQVDRGRDQ